MPTTKTHYIPAGYHSVTPYIITRNAARALDWYKNVFGAQEEIRFPAPDGKIGHAEIKIGDSHIMLADENPAMGQGHTSATTIGQSPVSLYVYLPDVDTVVKRAAAEGAKILKPVENQFYGDRVASVMDRWGNTWSIGTHVEDVPPDEMERRMKAQKK